MMNNTTITSLNLGVCRIELEEMKKISNAMKYNTTLKNLILNGNCIEKQGVKCLFESIKNNTSLKRIDLGLLFFSFLFLVRFEKKRKKKEENEINDEGFEIISEFLKTNSSLQELKIGILFVIRLDSMIFLTLSINSFIFFVWEGNQDDLFRSIGTSLIFKALKENNGLTTLNLGLQRNFSNYAI